MSQSNDPDDDTLGSQSERFPVKVAGPDVRLGKDDERNGLTASDKPELIGRDLLRTPVLLIDSRETEVEAIVHPVIIVGPPRCR